MQNLIYIVLFVIVIMCIFIIIFIRNINKNNDVKRLLNDITNNSQYRRSEAHALPHNDPLMRNKLIEEKMNNENQVSIYDPLGLQIQQDDSRIVGIVEPKGFWSRFIMKGQLENIFARISIQNSNKQEGFWVNLINAQSISQGKDQGRSR